MTAPTDALPWSLPKRLALRWNVPVKMFAAQILLMAGFVALPDLGRVAPALFPPSPPQHRPWLRVAIKLVVVGLILVPALVDRRDERERKAAREAGAVVGTYRVEALSRNGVAPVPPDEGKRWSVVDVAAKYVRVRAMDGTMFGFKMARDDAAGTMVGTSKVAGAAYLHYQLEGDHATLSGLVGTDAVVVRLRRIDRDQLTLMKGGGPHWLADDIDMR